MYHVGQGQAQRRQQPTVPVGQGRQSGGYSVSEWAPDPELHPDTPVNVHSVHAQGPGDGTSMLPTSSPEAGQHMGRGVMASCLGNQKGISGPPYPPGPPTPPQARAVVGVPA